MSNNRFYIAEVKARAHLNGIHNIYESKDLPSYVDISYTPIEVFKMMTDRGDCTHDIDLDENELIHLDETHLVRIIWDDSQPVGLYASHKNQDDEMCGGTIWFKDDEWHLKSLEPLTVMPSINCDYCESHGIIRNGKWEEALTKEQADALQGSVQDAQHNHEAVQVSGSEISS